MPYIFALLSLLLAVATHADNPTPQRVLLISIDGYRHDYTALHKPPFLTEFRQRGAVLASLRPAFPTKTFPNHLTLVTGMLPAHHGIVYNSFYAPDIGRPYNKSQRAAVTNPDFYLAEPLWVLLERQGRKTATYFWPGSEASIGGISPSIVKPYNKSTPTQARIDEVLGWIGQRGPDAPAFMTLYFSQVDDAGHVHGPTSKATKAAIFSLDKQLKMLWTQAQKLDPSLNLVIVSDHGMQALVAGQTEPLVKAGSEQLLENYRWVGNGPTVQLYKKNNATAPARVAAALNQTAQHFACHTPVSAPAALAITNTQRMGDILCVADQRWNIATPNARSFSKGNHGWHAQEQLDPAAKDLHGIFYAQGPAFKTGVVHTTQDNIHVMPLLAKILGVETSKDLDGSAAALTPLLHQN
ncbi:ectonucleotide pyrophosphatase/phosphodiesterase [Simiduia aestuariiviva]|uniref:Alkaline phosphatase D n=1 Tax=Simiduia aestuariiviva TaxID=1510459 RepID=A0A839URZ5_9GAMM|nr:ectonucleotide pyrophosphatase/phosphodiesterase [Simiduia aestuariiviva]MBB3169481.1 alkaline phosphatase D [Simiduia aestuariiviva]